MQQIFTAAHEGPQGTHSLWHAGGPREVFLAADKAKAVIGTAIVGPNDDRSKLYGRFVAKVSAQLTDDGHLTSAGGQYCQKFGIEPTVDALTKWASIPEPKGFR